MHVSMAASFVGLIPSLVAYSSWNGLVSLLCGRIVRSVSSISLLFVRNWYLIGVGPGSNDIFSFGLRWMVQRFLVCLRVDPFGDKFDSLSFSTYLLANLTYGWSANFPCKWLDKFAWKWQIYFYWFATWFVNGLRIVTLSHGLQLWTRCKFTINRL